MSIKYIVTGTGRCGTMFMSKYLTSAGIECGHEKIFTNSGIASAIKNLYKSNLDADASYMAAPFLDYTLFKKAKIIHLVRDPIKVINSFVSGYKYFLSSILNCNKSYGIWTYEYPPGADPDFKFMTFIYSYVPSLANPNLSPVERAALYYIEWNKIIENKCKKMEYLLFPIESNLEALNDFVGIKDSEKLFKDHANVCEYKSEYTLSNIKSKYIKNELIAIGTKYGYFGNQIKIKI